VCYQTKKTASISENLCTLCENSFSKRCCPLNLQKVLFLLLFGQKFLDLSVLHRRTVSIGHGGVGSSVLVLKGQCHEIFDSHVFLLQSTPSRSLIHGLKPFGIWLRIHQDNRFENRQNRIRPRGLIDTAGTDPAVSLKPRKLMQRSH
jgi:hypothetical protein